MFCPNCGRNIPDRSQICFACGKHIPAQLMASSKNSTVWLGLLIPVLAMMMAGTLLYPRRSPFTTQFASTASYSVLRHNIDRTAYSRNGLKIGTVTAVVPRVMGNRTVYVYEVTSDGRVLQLAPEAVRLH